MLHGANATRKRVQGFADRLGERNRAPFPRLEILPVVNPPAFPSRLHGPMARLTAAVVEITGPDSLRDKLRRAGEGDLPDDQVDALGMELDLLAGLLASGR